MSMLMAFKHGLDQALLAWMQADWPIALLLAFGLHASIFLLGGGVGWWLTRWLWPRMGWGRALDEHPPKPGQVRAELANGVRACAVFAVVTLGYPLLCDGLWPRSWAEAARQLAAFVVFNNVYSYATHRLLHTRRLIRFHGVHHRSVRTTPFSGYSVHAIEAFVMAGTLPFFMALMPLGLGTALALHAIGMVYTTCIHCNYDLAPWLSDAHWFKRLINHPTYHRLHHTLGHVNYGFTNRVMDIVFRTSRG